MKYSILYHPGIKATVNGMATHILSRQGQSQTNAVKAQDYSNSVLRPAQCFAGGLYATRNNNQLGCLLRNSTEAPKSIAKSMLSKGSKSILLKGVLLLHDNARSHTSRTTRELIESFGCEAFDHAPYSPDLAPNDFHLFRNLKHRLGGKRFSDN
ncbi:histone-lysine N-methyltransferase SETMAR [Trichonephila clavipes]|nr:histone-lysine N-methyltransferase SETMAR [Trichonephila clavipes]